MVGKGLFAFAYRLVGRARTARGVSRLGLQQRALEASRDGIVITGPAERDHPILYVNPAFERAYGYPAREIVGRNCRFLQAGDTDQPALRELRAALREGRGFTGVVRNYHRDGRLIYNELSISPVRDLRGRLTNFIGIQNDITDRVRAEQEREESERRLSTLLAQHGSEMITILAPDGTPRYESPAVGRALGYEHAKEADGALLQNVHPDDAAKLTEAVAGCLAAPGESPPVEYRIRHADGSWRHFESVGNNLASDPEVRGVVVNTRDITARKRAEEDRRRADERFRAVVHNSSEIVKIVKTDGTLVYASPAFERIFGYGPEQRRNMNVLDYVHPDDLPRVAEDTREALEGLESGSGEAPSNRTEYRFRCADGSWRCIEGVGTYLPHHPDIEGVVINARDVTERKRDEAALAESEARYRAVVEDQTELICRFSPDLALTFVNSAYCRYFDKSPEELVGTSFLSLVPPEDHEKIRTHLEGVRATGEPVSYEHRVTTSAGEIRWQQWTDRAIFDGGRLLEYQSVGRDITLRREAEDALRSSEAHFQRVVETLGEGLIVTDADDLVLDVNSRMTELVGYSREQMLGRPAYELLLPPEEQSSMFERNRQRLSRGEREDYERRLRRSDGSWFWAAISAVPYHDSAGEAVGTLGTVTDITSRKQAEEALQESEERFRQLFEHSVDALFVHDARGAIRDVNAEACRSTGYSREELLSMRVADLTDDLISEQERAERERTGGTLWRRLVSGDPRIHSAVHLGSHRRKDGTTFPIEVRVGGVDYGGERMILASARDITERRELEDQLEHLAFHDDLTGIPNRAHFMDRLEQALARAERVGNSVAVLFMDLDDFKLVNDSLGHSMGDLLLYTVARRLENCLRPGDVVARFGGDEFTILLEDTARVENATLLAERTAERLQAPMTLGDQEVFIKASFGIAFSAPGRNDPEALMRDADATMYRAKASGKGHYEVSDPGMNLRAMQRLQLENDLRRAVESPERHFEVHYQPKVSVRSGETTGVEALLRWRPPEGGLIYPESFIPLAEESGTIVALGRWVLRSACSWTREQRELGRPVNVSVNLSARQFREPDLVQSVARILHETGAGPESLTLEITEGVVLEYEEVFEKLRQLKSLGVKIDLDDFGTGYSSLSYLKHLPVDAVKIDKSFIDGLGKNREDTVLVSAIINLARALELDAVAEGVQTSAQLEKLREMECPQAQGYLFSGPLPAAEAAEFIAGGPGAGR